MGASCVNVMTLPNGLTVVTEERHHAPVVSFWTSYRVGSRNETPGFTGIAHWIEHMLFKPTEQFPGNERDRLIAREGGTTNAFTWIDGTAYYTTIPASKADLALRVEADRMANSAFEPTIFETERTVILAERSGSENQPDWRLTEQVTAAAFQAHPYRHEVIGLTEDLKRMTRDDLYRFYRTYYTPNNATAIAVGSFNTRAMQARIEELFGSIPPGPQPPAVLVTEPEPAGEHRILLEGPGATAYQEFLYRAPAANDPDFPATVVLATLLGGPVGLAFGGGGANRSSRLYRALVETGLAVEVDCDVEGTVNPYVLDISVMLRSPRAHEEVERAVDAVIRDIVSKHVPEAELAKGKKQVTAQFVFGNERITDRGMMLMMAHTVFDLELLESFPARVAAITSADLQRVAERVLRRKNRVVGWYVPLEIDRDEAEEAAEAGADR